MSDYRVLSICCDESLKELLIAELADSGFEGFVENDEGFEAYIENKDFSSQQCRNIFDKYSIAPMQVSENNIARQNWNAEWESNFKPVVIDETIIIKAPFHNVSQQYPFELTIQPKTSFGTGHHETTQLMLQQMLNISFKNKQVFDFGCGTGVLSVMASKLGAANVFANDIDEWAYENVGENCNLNRVQNIQYAKGGIEVIPQIEFNIILANINKNILVQNMEALANRLSKNGQLLMSGFYESDLPDLLTMAEKHHLKLDRHNIMANWCAALIVN